MINILKRINFLPGIILIIIFITPALFAQRIAQFILRLMNNFFSYFDYMGISGGYLGKFYELLIVEGFGSAVYCGGMLLFPMYLNKRFFKKFEINWLPGIILVFLFFGLASLYALYLFFFKALGNIDWIDTVTYIVGFIAYTAGFLAVIFYSLQYSETKNKYVKKILDKFQ